MTRAEFKWAKKLGKRGRAVVLNANLSPDPIFGNLNLNRAAIVKAYLDKVGDTKTRTPFLA